MKVDHDNTGGDQAGKACCVLKYHLQKGPFYCLFCENIPGMVICLEKKKRHFHAISHPGLILGRNRASIFTREEAIQSLKFTEEAFKPDTLRWS